MAAPVVVMQGADDEHAFPSEVRWTIPGGRRQAYTDMAGKINESGARAVSLQHEFGIYGGPDGGWIVDLLRQLAVPVVTTLHTVLREPSDNQRSIVQAMARHSARVVVMAEKGADFLREIYDVPHSRIEVIPHGIPDLEITEEECRQLRSGMGWGARPVLLTFGLLSPNKGVEHAIGALPALVKKHPGVLYVIAGATHPNLVRQEGERYRWSLRNLAEQLGVADHIAFVDRFIPEKELVSLIAAADVYLTPYLSEAQITSGTLAFAFGLGKPVISTPYWYAQELLDGGAGVVVPFADSGAIAGAASDLLSDPAARQAMARRARCRGETMRWTAVGKRYAELLLKSTLTPRIEVAAPAPLPSAETAIMSFQQLERMTGPFGIFQHGLQDQPDPRHGFCADDNARVVVLLSGLPASTMTGRSDTIKNLHRQCVKSLWEAYHPKHRRFRNFMDVKGHWLEERGSEDSHGRVLWAMGLHLAGLPATERSLGRIMVFLEAVQAVKEFTSPRAWAFTLLGIGHFRSTGIAGLFLEEMRRHLADRLVRLYRATAGKGWHWFEEVVTYDNGKLPEALLMTYGGLPDSAYLETALSSLEFLLAGQTAPSGNFRPVGCRGFWRRGSAAARFDQQPLEAQAMTAACLRAAAVTGSPHWLAAAEQAGAWFAGGNDLGIPLALPATGGCYDGLMAGGVNENQGAESILASLQSSVDLGQAMVQRAVYRESRKPQLQTPDLLGRPMLSA